jgi:phosphatidylinositol glycan class M
MRKEWGIYGLALLSGLVHAVLILYGEWQDAHMRVSYTDIDYWVYSDAARHVYNGASSFDRHTYRYTPLLAWMLVPNEILGMWWGKALFSAAGVLAGILIYRVTNRSLVYASLWLFSPLTVNISTRGSSDSLIILLILLVFHELQRGRMNSAALWFGLAVHFRIFPIFFVVPIMAHFGWNIRKIIHFGIVSGSVCLGLVGLFYIKDGYRFLYEAYLYHFVRKDHRHNFSLFYYPIYLASSSGSSGLLSKILTFSGFVPQLGSLVFVGARFGRLNFMFAIFLQTVIFVAFNKVITAQYFLWYFGLLPVALHAVLENRSGDDKYGVVIQVVLAIVLWAGAEVFWLKASYGLEVEGKHNFRTLLAASACLFAAHIGLLVVFIRAFVNSRKYAKTEDSSVVSPRDQQKSPKPHRKPASSPRSRSRSKPAAASSDSEAPRRSSRLKELAEK